jgi:L-amino acid N-acyltransferase YncA
MTTVDVRELRPSDWADIRRIYAAGIDTGNATFETDVPSAKALDGKWTPGQRWVATLDERVVGWAAITPTSTRHCYRGVAETSVYVDLTHSGRGIGTSL